VWNPSPNVCKNWGREFLSPTQVEINAQKPPGKELERGLRIMEGIPKSRPPGWLKAV